MKTDKNFKLSKRSKTIIALSCNSNTARSDLKSALIQAEASEETARRQSLKSKGNRTKDGE